MKPKKGYLLVQSKSDLATSKQNAEKKNQWLNWMSDPKKPTLPHPRVADIKKTLGSIFAGLKL